MAKIIEFYVPEKFRPTTKWTPPSQRGKVLEFKLKVTIGTVLRTIGFIPTVFVLALSLFAQNGSTTLEMTPGAMGLEADKGSNIEIVHVLPLFCIAKDDAGKPKVSLAPTFECTHPIGEKTWSCTGVILDVVKDCEQVRVIHHAYIDRSGSEQSQGKAKKK